jgi:hypothetical protein
MNRRVGPFVLALIAVAMASPAQGGAPPQPPAQPAPDKEVADKLTELKEVVNDRKTSRDAEGCDVIAVLLKKWEAGLNDKDKAAVVKGFDSVFYNGKVRDPDKLQLYHAAATALGRIGKDGGKPLMALIKADRFPDKKEWIPLHERFIKELGKTKDETAIELLLQLANHHEPAIQGAAGEALGNFDDSKDAVRKQIVGTLIVRWGELESKGTPIDPANIDAQNARQTLAVISGKWNETLRKLTRQNLDKFKEWQEWHNKNKGKEWK